MGRSSGNIITQMGENKKSHAAGFWAAIFFLVESALQVSGITNLPLAVMLWGIAGVLFLYWLGHTLNNRREKHGKPRLNLEPSHLIIFGLIGAALCLVIVAGGYVWQQLWPKAAAIGPTVPSSSQSQPTQLSVPQTQPYRLTNNSLPPNAQTVIRVSDGASIPPDPRNADFQIYTAWLAAGYTPDPVQAVLPRTYASRSPTDADREIPIIDKLYDILQKEAQPQVQQGFGDWRDALDADKTEAYFKALDALRDQFRIISGKLRDATQEIPQFCEDDLSVIVDPRKDDNVTRALDKLRAILTSLRNVVDPEKFKSSRQTNRFFDVLAPHLQAVGSALTAYGIWISWTERQLLDRRKELSEIASRKR